MKAYLLLYTLALLVALATEALPEFLEVYHDSNGLLLDEPKLNLPYANEPVSKADTPPPPTPPTNPTPVDKIYFDARCRGSNLMKAMTLDEAESSELLKWPYTHSPWDGGLQHDFATWGYHEVAPDDHELEAACDFETHHEMSRIFQDLEINA